jgi:hypothetical protein
MTDKDANVSWEKGFNSPRALYSGYNQILEELGDVKQLITDTDLENIGQNLDTVSAQLADKASKDIAGFYWVPEPQPKARPADFVEIDLQYSTYNQFITLWLNLQAQYPEYIKKTLLGKDSSGLFDVYRFVLSPKKPKKTMVISAGVHGDEKVGQYAMYRMAKYLCENWNNPHLSYIKSEVELVILPCVTPYGYENRKRWNFNGININRNFDYKWNQYTSVDANDQKGTAPFSEIEAQYVRDTLLLYKEKCVAYLDIHSTGLNAMHTRAVLPINADSFRYIYDNLTPFMARGSATPAEKYDIDDVIPATHNYGWHMLGIPSSISEFDDQKWGLMYSSESITKSLEWNANLILKYTKLDRQSNSGIQVFEQTYSFTSESVVISNTGAIGSSAYIENPLLQLELPVAFDGIALVNYSMTLKGDTAGMTTFIVPRLFQYGGIDKNETSAANSIADRYENYFDGNARTSLSLTAMMPIVSGGNFHVGVGHYVTSGTSQIYRYRVVVQLIPSINKPRAASYRKNTAADNLVRYNV